MKLIDFMLLIAYASVVGDCSVIIDLTHPFNNKTVYWPKRQNFKLLVDFKGMTSRGYWMETNTFSASEHGGTHVDAPSHFSVVGQKIHEIPIDCLLGKGVVISIQNKTSTSADVELQISDIEAWELIHGIIPNGSIVLIYTGWDRYWNNKTAYLGTMHDDAHNLQFPGVSYEAAKMLVQRNVKGVGIDTASIDPGSSKDFLTHQTLSSANIYCIENLKNLNRLPAKNFELIVAPMKIEDGSGAPARVFAVICEIASRSARVSANTALCCFFLIILIMHSFATENRQVSSPLLQCQLPVC